MSKVAAPESAVGRVIAHERRVVSLASEHASHDRYAPFYRAQIAAAIADFHDAGTSDNAMESILSEAESDGPPFLRAVARVLGTTAHELDPRESGIVRLSTALTPYLRARVLFVPVRHRGSLPALQPVHAARFAYLCHGITALAGLAGVPNLTVQTITSLARRFEHLLRLLVIVDQVVTWSNEAEIPLGLAQKQVWLKRYITLARALLPARQRVLQVPLIDLLEKAADVDELDRLAFLVRIGRCLAGRVAPMPSRRGSQAPVAPMHRAQRLALRYLPQEVLIYAASRASGTSD